MSVCGYCDGDVRSSGWSVSRFSLGDMVLEGLPSVSLVLLELSVEVTYGVGRSGGKDFKHYNR